MKIIISGPLTDINTTSTIPICLQVRRAKSLHLIKGLSTDRLTLKIRILLGLRLPGDSFLLNSCNSKYSRTHNSNKILPKIKIEMGMTGEMLDVNALYFE